MKVSVVGLGKLGSPMAACVAAKGHQVIGVDINRSFVEAINQGRPPVFEPGLAEMVTRAKGNLTATTDIHEAIVQTDLTFLIVPTPSKPDGFFSLEYVLAAGKSIGRALSEKSSRHLLVLTSTVMPGATQAELRPLLERVSGKSCPQDFGLCYSPEFISLGSVIRDYLHPDFVLIGESDEESGRTLGDFYQTVCENKPPVKRMNFVNAELSKLALNAFVTTKISYANTIAELCERLDGGNVDVVTSAIGTDSRIGSKYLKGSLGYGGPCFPRDSVAIASLGRALGMTPSLPEATDAVNHTQVPRLMELALSQLPPDGTVAVLGLSYKPDTDVVERAQGLELAQALVRNHVSVTVCDPAAMISARRSLGDDVCYMENCHEAVRSADVIVVCTPWKQFQELQPADFTAHQKRRALIDCWRAFEKSPVAHACRYVRVGTDDVMRALQTRSHVERVAKAA